MLPEPIKLPKNSIETQFLFFFNIGAQIQELKKPKIENDDPFLARNVEGSKLYTSAFFDNPIPIICSTHFHASKDGIKKITNKLANDFNGLVTFAEYPCTYYPRYQNINTNNGASNDECSRELAELDNDVIQLGFAPLEFTLFKNGILAVVLRFTNARDLEDIDYVESITNLKQISPTGKIESQYETEKPIPFSMMKLAGNVMRAIEEDLVNYLNKLEMMVLPLEEGKSKGIEFHCTSHNNNKEDPSYETVEIPDLGYKVLNGKEDPSQGYKVLKTSDQSYANGKDKFHACLKITTPYIGTVFDLSNRDIGKVLENKTAARVYREREMQLVLASARMTKEFLDNFNDPEIYLERELPRRNLYHPGPSIVFIGRRGWACLVKEHRTASSESFQLNVVEIVLLVITSIVASTIYTREFIKVVTEKGNKEGRDTLPDLLNEKDKVKITNEKINRFADFVSRIKLGLPHLNMGVLLSAHISTHTGIAAIRRLKYLTKHDDLIMSANSLVENYNSFLTNIDQIWKTKQLITTKYALWVAIASCFFAIAVPGCIKYYENGSPAQHATATSEKDSYTVNSTESVSASSERP